MNKCPVTRCYPMPDCRPDMCPRCEHEDAAERAAIATEGQDRSAFERAVELIKAMRRPGQRVLAECHS